MSNPDPSFNQPVWRLHQLTFHARLLFVAGCWVILMPLGIWGLRGEIELWRQHFTWVALRYGLGSHLFSAFSLFFCVAITAAVLVRQSLYILQGMPARERQRLEKRVKKIQLAGPRHPLWKWVFGTHCR